LVKGMRKRLEYVISVNGAAFFVFTSSINCFARLLSFDCAIQNCVYVMSFITASIASELQNA